MSITNCILVVALLLLFVLYERSIYKRKRKVEQAIMLKRIPCDKLSQGDMGVKFHFVIENGREDTLADYTAVYGYPNYLFRTDSRQKWTNEETENNFCLFRGENDTNTDWKHYEERQILNRYLRTEFYLLADKKSITNRSFYKRIRFFNLYFEDGEGNPVNLIFTEDIKIMIMAIMKKFADNKRLIPLCAVGHADE